MTGLFSFYPEHLFPVDVAHMRFFADAMPLKVWIADGKGQLIYLNERYREYTGVPQQEVVANIRNILHPDDLDVYTQIWRRAAESGEDIRLTHRLRRADGIYRWHLSEGRAQRNAESAIVLWLGTCTDIDEQKRNEEALQESEAQFRMLFEALPHMVWVTLADGKNVYFNQRWYDYTHTTFEESCDGGWTRFVHPDDLQHALEVWQHSLRTGEPYQIEYRLFNSSTGAYRWFLGRAMPMYDSKGMVVRWFGTCTDIDDHKRMEQALRQSQLRAQKLMDANIIGIMVSNQSHILEANDALLEMMGYTREDLQQGRMNWQAMTPPEYRHLDELAMQELALHGRCRPYEKEFIRKDGGRVPTLIGIVELQKDPAQYISFTLDISEQKKLERRKDDFIGMASHELKTPLTTLKVQEQLLRKRFEKQDAHDAIQMLGKMETQLNRLTGLINDLLDISKMQSGKLVYKQETFDIDTLIAEAAETIQQNNPHCKIVLHGQAHHELQGDRERLHQVLTNLLVNAIKYSPAAARVDVFVKPGADAVTISVRDYGIGIPRNQLHKIFDRFYRVEDSTHKGFPGLGMGLYICSEIVRHHGGQITVDSEEGHGSTFHVTLPFHT